MPTSVELNQLRELQTLREKQRELDLLEAISARQVADDSHETANADLDQASRELHGSVGQPSLQLGRWLLLSSHVSQLEREATIKRDDAQRASTQEAQSRAVWQTANLCRQNIDEQVAFQARKEQRRSDDQQEREALSRHCLLQERRP